MFRDRLKRAMKAGRRLLGRDSREELRDEPPRTSTRAAATPVDMSVIPRVQDGRGDTPGPGNVADMGRPYAAAQLLAGEGVLAVDVRTPSEWVAGHLPKALSLPASAAEAGLDLLPPASGEVNLVVYDATGGDEAATVAELLRENGWAARRLVGGFAEWLREGEEITRPEPHEGAAYQVGDTVIAKAGSATVWRVFAGEEGEPRYDILVHGTGEVARGLSQEELKS